MSQDLDVCFIVLFIFHLQFFASFLVNFDPLLLSTTVLPIRMLSPLSCAGVFYASCGPFILDFLRFIFFISKVGLWLALRSLYIIYLMYYGRAQPLLLGCFIDGNLWQIMPILVILDLRLISKHSSRCLTVTFGNFNDFLTMVIWCKISITTIEKINFNLVWVLKKHDLRHVWSIQCTSVSTLQLVLLLLDEIVISHLKCWYLILYECTVISTVLFIDVLLQVRVVKLWRFWWLISGLLFIVIAFGNLLVSLRNTGHGWD